MCSTPRRPHRPRRPSRSWRKLPRVPGADSEDALRGLIDRYNDAWNRQDVDAIVEMHTADIVFHNHTAGEQV